MLTFTEDELAEVYEALALKDELGHRLERVHPDEKKSESAVLGKVSKEFSDRTSFKIRQGMMDMLDDYIDHEVDEEMMWQGIEDQLRRKSEE